MTTAILSNSPEEEAQIGLYTQVKRINEVS